jgi:hypothetical protein
VPSRTPPPPWARRAADALLAWTAATIPLSISGMEIGIGGLAGLALVGTARGWAVARRTPLDGAIGVFFAALALSTLASGRPWEGTGWDRPWVVIGYFGVAWWLRDRDHAATFVRVLVVAGVVAGAYGVVQHFTGIDSYRALVGRPRVVRPRDVGYDGYAAVGFFGSYITYGHAMLFPLAWSAALAARGRILGLLAAAVLLVAIGFSTARGAWIAAAAACVTVVLLARSRRALAAGAALAAIAAAVVLSSADLRGHAAGIVALEGENARRLAIFRANLDIVHEHPVFGLGFGRYERAARTYYDAHPLADRRSHAHNNVLQIAAEAGLFGLAAFAYLWAVVLRVGWGAIRRAATAEHWAAAAGAYAGVVAFLVGGLTQYNFGDNEVSVALWAALAVLARTAEA